jgi:hypothetical protein
MIVIIKSYMEQSNRSNFRSGDFTGVKLPTNKILSFSNMRISAENFINISK